MIGEDSDTKTAASGQNALLSLLSQEDFDGIRNQIHLRIREDKIEENPAEEADEYSINEPLGKPTSDDEGGVVMTRVAVGKPRHGTMQTKA